MIIKSQKSLFPKLQVKEENSEKEKTPSPMRQTQKLSHSRSFNITMRPKNNMNKRGSLNASSVMSTPVKKVTQVQKINNLFEKLKVQKSQITFENTLLKQFKMQLDLHKSEINCRTDSLNELEKQIEYLRNYFMGEQQESQKKTRIIISLQDKNEELQIQVQNLTFRLNEMQNHYENENTEKFSELKDKIKKLQTENNNLESSLYTLKNIKFDIQQKNKELEQNLMQEANELKQLKKKIQEAEKERLEAEEQNSKNLSDSQSKIKEIMRLRKELATMTKEMTFLNDLVLNQKDELKNFYNVRPTRSELVEDLEKKEKYILQLESQLQEVKVRDKYFLEEVEKYKSDIKKKNEYTLKQNQKIQNLENEIEEEKIERQKVQGDFKKSLEKIEDLQKLIKQIKNQEAIIQESIFNMQKYERDLKKSLKCNFCSKLMKEPVTVIPCGHSFCIQCKNAYNGNICSKCGPENKIDAMYRNELLDDIITMFNFFSKIREDLQKINISDDLGL